MMLGNRAKFSFPLGDQFWAVKYIDQFNLAHARTRTASVQVMLQRLPVSSARDLSKLSVNVTKQLLGTRSKDPKPDLAFVSILAGALPAIRIGDILHNGAKVGELPSDTYRLTLAPGITEGTEVRANDNVEPLPGWGARDCRILNAFEYSGITDRKSVV